jgi:hypothetical protein
MKPDLHTILRDLKAAARIGHTESVWAALEGILEYPQISGNHHLDESFIKQVILPVGQALAQPLMNPAALRPLITHTHAGVRAIAGAALAEGFLKGVNGKGLKELSALAQDPRQDVRDAVLLACALPASHAPQKQTEIYQSWLAHSSPRLQGLALQLLPYLPEDAILQQIHKLKNFVPPKEPGARRSLAEAISKLGRGEYGPEILEILSGWAEDPDQFDWVITRCLSRSWAAAYPHDSLAILTQLAAVEGGRKKILGALKALQRHGAQQEVQAVLQDWLASGQPRLQSAARKAQKKSKPSKDLK